MDRETFENYQMQQQLQQQHDDAQSTMYAPQLQDSAVQLLLFQAYHSAEDNYTVYIWGRKLHARN